MKCLWQPGTDHAAIATEVKVTNKLKEQGIDKDEIGREKFLENCWEWKKSTADASKPVKKDWDPPLTGRESVSPWTRDAPKP